MCSVVGCESWRRSAHRFKLPQDPDERLEWVQFLFDINGQRLKESSWTDITICIEHFTNDCFENVSTAPVQLKSGAVPSVCIKSEPQEPTEPDQETVQREVTEDASQCDQLSTHDSPSSSSEESEPTSYASQESPKPSDNSDTSMYDYGQMLQKVENIDIIRDKVALLQIKGNYVVNENRLIPLFAHKCPLCGSKVKVEKLTYGMLIILNKQCIQCEYRDQWKSQVNARVPTDEDRHLTGGIDVTPETQQTESPDDDSSTVRGVLECVAYDNKLEVVQTTHVPSHFVSRGPCTSPTFKSEKSKHTFTGSQASPDEDSGFDHMQQKVMNIDSNHEKAELLQMEGKFVVNESCLLQLFRRKCPSCGCKLKMEKVTYGELIILNQQCLKCDYSFEWKSQINAIIPTDEDQHLTRDTEVSSETQQKMPTDGNPCSAVFSEIVTFSDEESNPSDEGEGGDEGGVSSDGEWSPTEDFMLEEELTKRSEEESEGESGEEEEEDFNSLGGLKINELCTDCGRFFSIMKPHTCEHKIKPYSCNICGKRCVTEKSLKVHSKIHDETYEHPCKYCHVTFKTRVDKRKHEQSHQDSKDPFKCPDCPATFVTSKERNIHLSSHRTTREFKCGVCGIEFKDVHHLRRHSVVHTGLKPYKCSVCKRGFNQTNHLKSHMRLHTGERPYKCQHCDHSFNHNVSLKSHVQRFHSTNSGCEQKKNKIKENDTDDAKENGNKIDIICESDSVEEEQVVEKEAQKLRTKRPQSRKRSTGRPKGRPKRNSPGNVVLAGENHGQSLKTKTSKSKVQKLKKTGSSDEESEDSDISFHSVEGEEEEEEEEEGEKETVSKNTGRSRLRQNNDSDTDFDPGEEAKKKRFSSQSSSKSLGKFRSRPRKNLPL